jgi:hypothetical protein
MKYLVFIALLLIPFSSNKKYPLKGGKPTPKGIEMYIEDNRDSLVYEYLSFVKDTFWLDYWIYAEDLTNYVGHDSLELGRYFNGEIVIDMDTLFQAYELDDWSNFRRKIQGESNKFVKGVLFHELTHHYINQIGREMEYYDSVRVNRSYESNIWIIRSYDMFGSRFIEEGICEYLVTKMDELIPPKKYNKPKSKSDLLKPENNYKYVYKYSSEYLRIFLDTTGFKRGVKILIHNEPPTYQQILNPELYFNNLEYDGL